MTLVGNTAFQGPAGSLEALLKEPAGLVTNCAIVCHPHPLYGGTMHNKVVFRLARAFYQAGFATLRFNFRGTGRSEGEHDHGNGEQHDLRAAIDFMEQRHPSSQLWISGFSFGAAVMLPVACQDQRVFAVVAAGLPVSKYELGVCSDCDRPKLFVQGSHDQFGAVEEIRKFLESVSEPKQLSVIDNADHFFEGRLDEFESIVSEFVRLLVNRQHQL